jgi:hypothetical protein
VTFFLKGDGLSRSDRVLDVNPDLIEPFILRLTPPQAADRARAAPDWSFTFVYDGNLRTVTIIELATVAHARARLAQELKAPVSEIEIHRPSGDCAMATF